MQGILDLKDVKTAISCINEFWKVCSIAKNTGFYFHPKNFQTILTIYTSAQKVGLIFHPHCTNIWHDGHIRLSVARSVSYLLYTVRGVSRGEEGASGNECPFTEIWNLSPPESLIYWLKTSRIIIKEGKDGIIYGEPCYTLGRQPLLAHISNKHLNENNQSTYELCICFICVHCMLNNNLVEQSKTQCLNIYFFIHRT